MIRFNFLNIFNQFIIILFVISFLSCTKEERPINNLSNKSGIQTIPFFNLAKGDTIPKNICRDKPIFSSNEATVLFTTERNSKLKTTGNSIDFGEGYINNLYLSIRRDNSVGDWLWDGLRKIPVDLNEGAGGKWIYLFCSKGYSGEAFEYVYNFKISEFKDCFTGEFTVNKENGKPGDCNDGAGGSYVYIVGQRDGYYGGELYNFGPGPVKDIAIVSATTSTVILPGWYKIPGDLNRKAGGKYIYLFVKY